MFKTCTPVCDYADREAWLEARKKGIGSSDAAVLILGKHYGVTPFSLWAQKCGLVERESMEGQHLELGLELEPFIMARWRSESGKWAKLAQKMVRNNDHPFMLASLDAEFWTDGKLESTCPLELKTAGNLGAWDDGIPKAYWIQVQHQMAVTGAKQGAIAVLGGGFVMSFMHAKIERDDDFIDNELIPACTAFWELVDGETPPEDVDGSESTSKTLAKLYAIVDEEDVAVLDADMIDLWEELAEVKATAKACKERKGEIENIVKAKLKHCSRGILPNGAQFTWKQQTTHKKAQEASTNTFRVLRMKKGR